MMQEIKKNNKTSLSTMLLFWVLSLLSATAFSEDKSKDISKNTYLNSLVYFENSANPAFQAVGSDIKVLSIKHFEIPLKYLKLIYDSESTQDDLQNLIFIKNNEKYVRWIIYPDEYNANKYSLLRSKLPKPAYLEVEEWLRKNKLDYKKYTYFKGYKTSSRSLILQNPQTGMSFSLKTSTRYLREKPLEGISKIHKWTEAQREFLTYQYIKKRLKTTQPRYFFIQDEPQVFGLAEVNQAQSVRSLDHINIKNMHTVPAFALLDEKIGRRLAELNGYMDPSAFALKYFDQLGKAIAEMVFYTGLTSDSMHLQNFLLEMDSDYKWTGRVIFRDLGDSYLWKAYFNQLQESELIQRSEGQIYDHLKIEHYGLFQFGTLMPSWLNHEVWFQKRDYQSGTWMDRLFTAFEQTLAQLSGLPLEQIENKNHEYSRQIYFQNLELETQFINAIFNQQQNLEIKSCAEIF